MVRGYRIWLDRISTSYGTQPSYIEMCNEIVPLYCCIGASITSLAPIHIAFFLLVGGNL